MQKNVNGQKMYYFPEKLKRQLDQIPYHPLTVIEAPSGFGKTTAVREYLKNHLPAGAQEYWYTSLGEPASQTWKNFCELFSCINIEKANKLKRLGMPTVDTLMYLTSLLKECRQTDEVYLVVDNFQLWDCEIRYELLSVFSMHKCPNVHMIFITQHLGTKPQITFHNANIYTIEPSAFFFDRESTAGLFRMEGIRLTEDELNNVYSSTEGWVSAIRLQMINFVETGSFDYTADIDRLVETAIWNRLTPDEKEFLLIISVKDGFTALQAARMLQREVLPEHIRELLKSNDFIKYFPDKGLYTIHGILLDYLRNQFYYHQPRGFQERVLRRAGHCYAADSQLLTAAKCFLKIRDFEALLSLPFDETYLANWQGNNLVEIIKAVLDECSVETLCKHPFVLLVFSYSKMLNGKLENFQKLCRLIGQAIENNPARYSEKDLRRLKGEFTLLKALTKYNDVRRMSEEAKEALDILEGPSNILSKEVPWTFSCTSILCLYWREPGNLDETLRAIQEGLPYHLKLTSGQGTGGDSAVMAEVLLMRGRDDEAEILCHKALYEARSKQQISICICVEMLLARIAILRGDIDGYLTALGNIQGYTRGNTGLYVLRMAELCFSAVKIVLGMQDKAAEWLYDMESVKKTIYEPAVPYAQIIYAYLLLIERRYNEFYGIAPLVIEKAKSMHYIFPQVYYRIFMAVAKYNCGNHAEAQVHLKEALHLALPDGIYLPFSLQWDIIYDLLKSMPMSAGENREKLAGLIALCARQAKGVHRIQKALRQEESMLTPREKEVALLARERFSTREIAAKLYISEKTVKTILHNVYSKLEIHSKSELNKVEF